MGMDRRLVGRSKVFVDGDLEWATRRRIGGAKKHSVRVSTLDLSVEGAHLLTHGSAPLPPGASCRVVFDGLGANARVRQVKTYEAGRQTIRVQFEHASEDFHKMLEEWLDVRSGGRKFIQDRAS